MNPKTTTITASPPLLSLLSTLHAQSAAQERSLPQLLWYIRRSLAHYLFGTTWSASSDSHMRDKFVALEPEKCAFVYLLARSIGARNIVEAGTSFGVSTIYLGLAVGQNCLDRGGEAGIRGRGKVIATEKEPTKAERARRHWSMAGEEVEPWIELREGDLLETLKEGLPTVDMLLLDSTLPLTFIYSLPRYCDLNPADFPSSLDTTCAPHPPDCATSFTKGGASDCRQYGHGSGHV